jgi:hypothetical protein
MRTGPARPTIIADPRRRRTENALITRRYEATDQTPPYQHGRYFGTYRVRRSESLLRVFFLGSLTREQAVDYLHKEAEVTRRRQAILQMIDERADWEADDIAIYGHLALEYGHRLMAMYLGWIDWAVDQINTRHARAADA